MKEIVEQVGIQCLKCPNKLFLLHLNAYFSCADFTDTLIFVFFLLPTLGGDTYVYSHTHILFLTCSQFPTHLLRESDWARSNANWVKCSGKWLFPLGLLNSSSELALSLCVCVRLCVCVSQFLHLHLWVWKCKLLHMCLRAWKCERLDECVCSSLFLPGRSGLQTGLRF